MKKNVFDIFSITLHLEMENITDKKIAVLLSGGVDSSVVVYELARQGLHPDCFYIKMGPEEKRSGTVHQKKTWRWLQLLQPNMVVSWKL